MGGRSHEGYENMRLDARLLLVMDRPRRQVAFQVAERFFDVDQLDVEFHIWAGSRPTRVVRKRSRLCASTYTCPVSRHTTRRF